MKNTDTLLFGFRLNQNHTLKRVANIGLSKVLALPFILLLLCFSNNGYGQCTLACNNQINLSLSADCNSEVTYEMMLQNPNNTAVCTPTGDAAYFEITVMDQSGNGILPTSPFVTNAEIGLTLDVKVRHLASNNICWGTVLIEDKIAPALACPDNVTVQCTQATNTNVTGNPTVEECSDYNLTHVDNPSTMGCGDPMQIITRTFYANDSNGYTSNCTQLISIANPDINDIEFPLNLDNIEAPALACEAVSSNTVLTEPENTGVPTLSGAPIQGNASACGFNIAHTDNIIEICDGTYKILRSWTILEWCTSEILTEVQIIKVEDDDAPSLVCQSVINVGTTSSTSCTASVLLPAASVSDACSGIGEVTVFSQYGQTGSNGGLINNVPIGTHTITYQASDNCGNSATCESTIIVSDDDSPTVVCDEFTVVTLNQTGVSYVNAETFDDGSYDNCCLDSFTARRVQAGCGVSNTFGEQVIFCCEDIGQQVTVELRVTDCYGNANSCMVNATIEENSAPSIVCPTSVTLDCGQDYTDLNLTGEPTAQDGCGFITPTYNDLVNLNSCNTGTITRTWTVADNQGLNSNCQQTITIVDNTPLIVNFPPDYTAPACTQPSDLDPSDLPTGYNAPTYVNKDCEQPAVNVSDQFFQVAPPACFKIIRTWTVIDWCVYNPENSSTEGYYTDTQIIIVMDNDAPVVDCPEDFSVSTNGVECTASVTLPQPTATDCSNNIQTFVNSNLGAGFGPFNGVTPGIYTANYTISDGCGNTSICQTNIEVIENNLPTPYCVAGLTIELSPVDTNGDGETDNGIVDIWASDFDAGSYDNCGGTVQLSLSPDVTHHTQDYTCADLGANTVTLYVTDENGNQDYCQTILFVESVPNVCNSSSDDFVIAGAISDENGNMLSETMINVSSMEPIMTNEQGHYQLDAMTAGEDYTVFPQNNNNANNGVTTFDIVLMRRHILVQTLLDSPYKLIAADANNNGSVSTADMVVLRKLILTDYVEFPNNTSWRFIDAAYTFPNPANPFAETFPEFYNINDLSTDMMDVNFVAIKIGDLNGSASTNGFNNDSGEERTDKAFALQAVETYLEAGQTYRLPVTGQSAGKIQSSQFTLDFNVNAIADVNIECAENTVFAPANFSLGHKDTGIITAAWYADAAKAFNKEEVLFYLAFTANQDIYLSEVLNVSSNKTTAVAYNSTDESMNVTMTFEDAVKNQTSYLINKPNPFSDATNIEFYTESADAISLSITDINGRVIYRKESDFKKGKNVLRIDGNIFPQMGIYYCQLQTPTKRLIQKIVKGL